MKKIKWSDLKPILETHSRSALLALIKDMFEAMPDREAFFTARFFAESSDTQAVLEPYRQRVTEPFFPKRGGFGKLNLRDGRKAVSDYRKATHDIYGTLELMLTYVEQGTRFTNEYGDIDEPFYNSLVSMLTAFVKLIHEHPEHYPDFRERLLKLVKASSHIGWGYGDDVGDIVGEIEENFGAADA